MLSQIQIIHNRALTELLQAFQKKKTELLQKITLVSGDRPANI